MSFHGFSTFGLLLELENSTATPEPVGFISGGSITLDRASTDGGGGVTGSFSGVVLSGMAAP